MASEAFAGVGTKFQRWDGAAWQDIAEVNSIDGPGMTKDVLEVTSLDTDAGYNEFITGFAEGGTLTLDMNFTRETYELMKEDFESDEVRSYRIQLPDYDSEPSTFTIEGLVIELPITMTADDKVTADVVIQITSQVVLEEDSWSSYWTTQYDAVYNAMTIKPGNEDMYYQSRLVKRLVNASIWAKFIRFFVRAIHTNTNGEALIDWVDPTRHSTAVNNPTFTAYQGFKGNGTNMYIKSGFTPKTDGGLLFVQDNAMYGCYSRTGGAVGGTVYEMGNRDVTLFDDVNEYLGVCVSADGSTIGINGSGVVGCNKVRNLGLGLCAVGRKSATAIEYWENGESREVGTASNSVGLCSHEFFELAAAYKTTPLYYSSRELSMSFYGSALTLEEMQVLTAAFEEYMVSVGKGVVPEKRLVVVGDSISTNTTDKWLFKIPYNAYVQQSYAVAGHSIMANMDAQIVSAKAENAQIYILALGRNDNELGDMGALQAEVEENIAELKAARPSANIYYMNVLPTWTDAGGGTEVAKTNIRAAIAAACAAQGITCWDTYTTPWITAADTSDGTHPNDAGNIKIWNEIASRL